MAQDLSYDQDVERAWRAAQADSLELAETLYAKVLKDYEGDRRNALVHHDLGHVQEMIYWRNTDDTKRVEEAVYHYTKAIELLPQSPLMRYARADLYLNLKSYGKAILDYSEIIIHHPNDTIALNRRAYAYFQQRDYDKALADYQSVLQVRPSDYLSALGVVLVLQKTNKVGEAIRRMEFLIATYPDNAELYVVRASMYEEQSLNELALLDLNKAIELEPTHEHYHLRGDLYKKMGKPRLAEKDYRF